MAHDERPDDAKAKRRAKSPVITLEATDMTPAEATKAETAAGLSEPGVEPAAKTESQASSDAQAEVAAATPEPAAAASEADTAGPADHSEPGRPSAETATPPAPPLHTEPTAAPQPGFGRLAAAGLIGALISGGLGYGAAVSGLLPAASRTEVAALEQRIVDLDRALREANARTPPAPDLSALTRQIAAWDAARAALDTRLAALERRPAEPAGSQTATTEPVDLSPLTREIDALKAAVAALGEQQARTASLPPAGIAGPDLAAVENRVGSELGTQAQRIDGIQARVQNLGADVAAATEAARGLATRLAALDSARAEAAGTGQKAAVLVGIEVLRSAVDRGRPYAAELRALKALGADAAALQPLEAASERGVPSASALARQFSGLGSAMTRAVPRPSDGSLLDRLAANAQALIRIRPVGEAAGDDTSVVIARIEAKLGRGDLAGALAEFGKLPEPVKAVAKDWEAQARARLAADTALKRMADEAMGALAAR
ncbi:Mitochondrial inner membrane protein [bacterium YEK0313]|nr:Mitochondrial inner membrane protein [bacterium YEK0313]